jgi:1-acyl-sn-glycerol-3-phosphate acyltransferase
LEKAAREMGETPLVVFPEGTRSKDGSLLPFKLGGSRLAVLAEALIIPVLIQGSRDAAENRAASGGPGRVPIRLRIFPAMDARGLDESKPSLNAIKDYVERCWRSPNGLT